MEFVAKYGLGIRERDYPYNGSNGTCPARHNAFPRVVLSSYTVLRQTDDQSLVHALASGPVAIGFHADPSFVEYRRGIYTPGYCCCANNLSATDYDMNHALLLVGYGFDQELYWIAMNTWGEQWGEDGFVRIRRGDGCGITMQAVVATDVRIDYGGRGVKIFASSCAAALTFFGLLLRRRRTSSRCGHPKNFFGVGSRKTSSNIFASARNEKISIPDKAPDERIGLVRNEPQYTLDERMSLLEKTPPTHYTDGL
eukprot:CAMPEP_0194299832 /NCGR_PEP_ID=MMETSP0169-20130528/60930_1 /TAXON_ID=218684 /ORGANISM="Corethron pennatum, Strain L29A3" /LENGTH=253 /DNA_ID=CAMNT_0039049953 /DNA_START=414 /DNA_END=1175 /DNA_ORIENTATION=-